MSTDISRKAFAVWFKDLDRWDCKSFQQVAWRWPPEEIKPLGKILKRKQVEVVDRDDLTRTPIIKKITFGGEISLTDEKERKGYKGRLFWASEGELIYSKIRVKQGSLAIVPEKMERIAVSAEYPVYDLDQSQINPTFLALVLKSKSFLNLFEGQAHGGATKTRIPPEVFETQPIPIPPPNVQKAIVERWQKAQAEIKTTYERVETLKDEIEAEFFKELGLRTPQEITLPKAFAVLWEDLLRWGINYNQQAQTGTDLRKGKYPVVQLGSILALIQYGTSEKANREAKGVPVIRMNNISEGLLDLRNLKHIELSESEKDNLILKDGDILINRTNSKELVGKCAVFHEDGDYVFASYLIRLKPDVNVAYADYLSYVLNSRIGRQQINALSRQIIGQANINTEELRSLQIPLPPLAVQLTTVRRITEGQEKIAREREKAENRAREIESEIEELILGTKQL